ncbi:MAG: citrate synthase, partial [Monoglobaceae bacterium]
FGELPTADELKEFNSVLGNYRSLPVNFVTDSILKVASSDMMNMLSRSVLTLYAYDSNANDLSIQNVLRQCLELIALFPVLAVYGYQAYNRYYKGESLFIHKPQENLSTAENILLLLRPDEKYTDLEAKILDLALVLQAEHGGGNNSTFTTHVVTSSGTDTYSAISAALGSLKGIRHGGANVKVVNMLENIRENVSDWTDDAEIKSYLKKIIDGEAFDKSGLIYGMGHAVYSLSDPRADIFKAFVKRLAAAKGYEKEYNLCEKIENLAPEVIADKRKIYKGVSANVDFYSGFVYEMLGLPRELYTPLFAVARIAGWSAHRIEELLNEGKIIRPAYKSIAPRRNYVEMKLR